MASRVFSSAQTAAKPEADMVQPRLPPEMMSLIFVSGVESVAILPAKLFSSAVASPVWASVEPIRPN